MNKLTSSQVKQWSLVSSCVLAAGLVTGTAQAGDFDDALTGGKVNLDMRLRYETVEDNVNNDAKAGTLRTRLGYTTGDYNGLSAFAEFEDVRFAGGLDEYTPVRAGYATVADPEVTQLNQSILAYKNNSTTAKLGRQRIILDNARHVGNVGWRQNEQTFDAFSVVNTSIPDTTLTYAFLDKVHGITTTFDADVSDHLANIAYAGFKPVKVVVYAYLLEDNFTKLTSDTTGLRLDGKSELSQSSSLLYTVEFAAQSTDTNDATYSFVEGGIKYGELTAKAGYEVLGSDDGAYGFQTPLATKHAFNGWADKFLATPTAGLTDLMVTLGGKVAGVKLLGVYHDFSSDEGSVDYGTEVDLLAAKKFGKRYTLGIKHASFSAEAPNADTSKLWVWGELKI